MGNTKTYYIEGELRSGITLVGDRLEDRKGRA